MPDDETIRCPGITLESGIVKKMQELWKVKTGKVHGAFQGVLSRGAVLAIQELENAAGTSIAQSPYSGKNKDWHDKLEFILNEGTANQKEIIQGIMREFFRQIKASPAARRKSGS